jgi:hypothetical protein
MLSGLSDRLQRIVDVTIVYPEQVKGFWSFACGEIGEIRVHVRSLPVTDDLIGDYADDRQFRVRFHRWLNQLWSEKDRRIDHLLGHPVEDPGQRYGPILPEASRPVPEAVET